MKQHYIKIIPSLRTCRILSLLAVFLLLSACAAVNPLNTQPFQDYQSAISTLKDESNQALQTVYETELDQFKSSITAGDNCQAQQLLLNFPPDSAYAYAYPPLPSNCDLPQQPLFASIADMQQTLDAMNSELLSYASLLIALAGADDSTQFDPVSEAQKFDQNATSLLTQLNGLGVNTSSVSSGGLALFSTIGANLAKAYLEGKRVELLTQVLNEGIQPLQNFSNLAQQAMDITAQNAKTQYQNQAPDVLRGIITGQGSGGVDNLLSLNDQITKQLDLYKNIAGGYAALPSSQRQLITAVQQNQHVNLAELINYATNIKQQYQSLKSSTAGGAPAGGE